ncbi:MAG: rhomboid family intramembrane serine protease [Bacteroidota bacterium]|nr:rhomboid family intramembrane serine protease [Bacteroidota bacterium]
MSYQQYRPQSFNILPVVIKNLLIINVLLYLAETVFEQQLGFSFNQRFGLYYPESERFIPFQFVTHMFLHGSWMHLFFNMLALWMLGGVLENYWGPKRFLVFYFTTGIGAALVHTFFSWYELSQLWETIQLYSSAPNPLDFETLSKRGYLSNYNSEQVDAFIAAWKLMPGNQDMAAQSVMLVEQLATTKMNIPTVGASGAVFGVLLAFGMLFPNQIIFLYFFPIKAKYFVILYGAWELALGVTNSPGDPVAHFAHLGGMLFGFILIKFWNKKNREHFY